MNELQISAGDAVQNHPLLTFWIVIVVTAIAAVVIELAERANEGTISNKTFAAERLQPS